MASDATKSINFTSQRHSGQRQPAVQRCENGGRRCDRRRVGHFNERCLNDGRLFPRAGDRWVAVPFNSFVGQSLYSVFVKECQYLISAIYLQTFPLRNSKFP